MYLALAKLLRNYNLFCLRRPESLQAQPLSPPMPQAGEHLEAKEGCKAVLTLSQIVRAEARSLRSKSARRIRIEFAKKSTAELRNSAAINRVNSASKPGRASRVISGQSRAPLNPRGSKYPLAGGKMTGRENRPCRNYCLISYKTP
jgi:hypothetical protein